MKTSTLNPMVPLLVLALYAPALAIDPDPPLDPESDDVEVEIQEWTVPWEPTGIADWPRDPYMGPDGGVWFAGQRGDFIGRLDPATGQFDRWPLADGAEPHNVIVDADGYPWYAALSGDHIGRLDPATGEVTEYPAPEGVRGAHTQVWDADGNMWFTAYRSGHVVRFDVDSGEMEAVHVDAGTGPYGLWLDSRGHPWFTTMGNSIATVDPATMRPTVYETPGDDARTRRLAITSDDRVWWVDFAGGYFGVFDPATEEMRRWQSPGGPGSGPYAITVDDQDRVWYSETGAEPNHLVGFDTDAMEFFSVTEVLPSGGGTIRHITFHEPGNEIWFASDRQTVGRALLPD